MTSAGSSISLFKLLYTNKNVLNLVKFNQFSTTELLLQSPKYQIKSPLIYRSMVNKIDKCQRHKNDNWHQDVQTELQEEQDSMKRERDQEQTHEEHPF